MNIVISIVVAFAVIISSSSPICCSLTSNNETEAKNYDIVEAVCDECEQAKDLVEERWTFRKIMMMILAGRKNNNETENPGLDKKQHLLNILATTHYCKAKYGSIGFLVACGLLAIITNSLVIIAGIRTKMFEVSIMSLAIVDLLTGLVCCPYVAIVCYYFDYFGSGQLDTHVSDWVYTLPNMFQVCTVWHVLYITSIRILSISPYRSLADIWPGKKRKYEPLHVAIIWAGSIYICLMYQETDSCSEELFQFHYPFLLWIFIVLPGFITIILHIIIFYFANTVSKKRIAEEDDKKIIQNVKAAKTTFVVAITLIICYTPIAVQWQGCFNNFAFRLFAYAMVMANSFFNPIIYAFKMSSFRKALSRMASFRKVVERMTIHDMDPPL